MVKEETRKGPWTEEEDGQLIRSVELLGDRRWDFIAKVSGLKRTGKSCRLRWVNYLNPCLKRGRITPQEERLILELHSRWGNRWSRIARRLPGRTDNEIKNYWRTQMRKKKTAQGGRTKATSSGEPKLEKAVEIPALKSSSLASYDGFQDCETRNISFSYMPSPLWDYAEEEDSPWDLEEDPTKFLPYPVFF